jgi:hypothetical protein
LNQVVATPRIQADHSRIDIPTEKDYIDVQFQALLERVSGETKVHQISMHAGLNKLEQSLRKSPTPNTHSLKPLFIAASAI